MSEEVLCVGTPLFRECGYFNGFRPLSSNYTPLFAESNQSFQPRDTVEEDSSYKQLIPYIIVERGQRLMAYWRGQGQGEKRLHGKRSIGIGGHINPCDLEYTQLGRLVDRDAFMSDMYTRGMLRELTEELRFKHQPSLWYMRTVGLVHEDQTEVGQVHLGVVHVLHLGAAVDCQANEDDIVDLEWRTKDRLVAEMNDFELWSRICLEHVDTARPEGRFDGMAVS
jgi:predicted NUDIX family phosphoesterase